MVCGWRPTVPTCGEDSRRIVGPPCGRAATRIYVEQVQDGEDLLCLAHGRCEWPKHTAADSRWAEQPLSYLEFVDYVHVGSLPAWSPAWPSPAELRGAVEDLLDCFTDDLGELVPSAPTAAHRATALLRRCP